MQVLKSRKALKKYIASVKSQKKSIGFVPTMGGLHEGHLSLVRLSNKENDLTVASIFVNPLQFGRGEDYRRYPRNEARDKALLRAAETDAVFIPGMEDFYPADFQTSAAVSRVSLPLCGKSRPTHFAGVTTVVLKLLNLVSPDRLYLGQKDYQQCRVLEQMIEDMDVPVTVRRAPIVRERDGLAMSSRNVFLSPEERQEAVILSRALSRAADFVQSGERDAKKLKKELLDTLRSAPLARVDYAEIVDARTLENVVRLMPGKDALIALAVYFSKTRLIDNRLVRLG